MSVQALGGAPWVLILMVVLLGPTGAAYPVQVDAVVGLEQATLFASDPAADDQFGVSIALSGDTAIVGANGNDNANGASAGAAYVFVRNGSLWTEQAKLVTGDGAANDQFGVSVALFGDTALVGAWNDDHAGGMNAGAAYVFVRSGGVWMEHAKLVASDGAANDQFGVSVALSGDTAIVGAHGNDNVKGVDAGATYVFVRNGLQWLEQAKLVAGDGAAGDQAGHSVALLADTALVGARRDDNANGMDAGAAYIFGRNGAQWLEQAKLVASDGQAVAYFGGSVALSTDTALVGAYGDDTLKGAAYAFIRNGAQWLEQAKLVAGAGAANDAFGYSVSLSGDTALVGAHHLDNPNGVETGAAVVFVRSGVQWIQEANLSPSDGDAFDWFGCAVALSDNTALVGAYRHANASFSLVGAAYVYGVGLSNGDACASNPQCAGGFCADGVCCDSPCGGSNSGDCLACSLAAGAAADGTCGVVSAAVVCRPAAGACDLAETCDGASDACPPDAFSPDGTPCLEGSCLSGVCEMGQGGATGAGASAGSTGQGGLAGSGNSTGQGGLAGHGGGASDDPSQEGACSCRTLGAAPTTGDMAPFLAAIGLLAATAGRSRNPLMRSSSQSPLSSRSPSSRSPSSRSRCRGRRRPRGRHVPVDTSLRTRDTPFVRALQYTAAWLFAAAVAFAGCTCSKSPETGAPSAEPPAEKVPFRGIIEERDDGQVEWMILPDGNVRAMVRTPDGKPIALADVRASVTVAGKTVHLTADGDTLAGTIPKLTADLTDVTYTLTVKGKEWKGVLHVPPGGTEDLLAEPTVTVPDAAVGPNGGGVEVVGNQRIELVTDEQSGEVRVYLLDENLKVMPVGDASVTIGFVE